MGGTYIPTSRNFHVNQISTSVSSVNSKHRPILKSQLLAWVQSWMPKQLVSQDVLDECDVQTQLIYPSGSQPVFNSLSNDSKFNVDWRWTPKDISPLENQELVVKKSFGVLGISMHQHCISFYSILSSMDKSAFRRFVDNSSTGLGGEIITRQHQRLFSHYYLWPNPLFDGLSTTCLSFWARNLTCTSTASAFIHSYPLSIKSLHPRLVDNSSTSLCGELSCASTIGFFHIIFY